jgi:hypothetical protein
MKDRIPGWRPAVLRGRLPGRPSAKTMEEARRFAREALSVLESIPRPMAEKLTLEFMRNARWRAELNLGLVLDAIARDERPRPGLRVVRSN